MAQQNLKDLFLTHPVTLWVFGFTRFGRFQSQGCGFPTWHGTGIQLQIPAASDGIVIYHPEGSYRCQVSHFRDFSEGFFSCGDFYITKAAIWRNPSELFGAILGMAAPKILIHIPFYNSRGGNLLWHVSCLPHGTATPFGKKNLGIVVAALTLTFCVKWLHHVVPSHSASRLSDFNEMSLQTLSEGVSSAGGVGNRRVVDTRRLPTPPALETPSPMCAVLVLTPVLMSEDWNW